MTSGKLVRSRKKRARKVPARTPRKGLCASCVRLQTCTYVVASSSPVVHCDEYDAGVSLETEHLGANPGTSGPSKNNVSPDEAVSADIGLCRHCAGRDACTYPRPEGGVWQCEEYR